MSTPMVWKPITPFQPKHQQKQNILTIIVRKDQLGVAVFLLLLRPAASNQLASGGHHVWIGHVLCVSHNIGNAQHR